MKHMRLTYTRGFSLIEVLVMIVIIGILASLAMQSMSVMVDDARVTKTQREMEMLSRAIVGDPSITQAGVRADFGYVGDNGAFPPSLTALRTNPGLGTWNGPYLPPGFIENTDGYRLDEWGDAYSYSGGTTITSNGSGTALTRKIADASSDYLANTLYGTVTDNAGSAPGIDYADSVEIVIYYPNGSGSIVSQSVAPSVSGQFALDSIPVGRHALDLIYTPDVDTVHRYVTILPRHKGTVLYRFTKPHFTESGSSSPTVDTLLFAQFTSNDDDFEYEDDLFRGTNHSNFATGQWVSSGGYSGGALETEVGGVNNGNITDMSGGWEIEIDVPVTVPVVVSFWYELKQSPEYENDEFSEMLMSFDGTLHGAAPDDFVAHIVGDGPGGPEITTGWQQFSVNLGTVAAGTHTLAVGGYNNKKTTINEVMWVVVDDILVVTAP